MARFGGPTPVRRRKVTPWVTSGLVVFFAGAPIACGGGGETTEATITKAEFVARTNRICDKVGEGAGSETRFVYRKHPPETDELLSLLRNLVPTVRQAIDEIEAIPAPVGDEEQVTAIVDAATEDVDRMERAITDPDALRALLHDGLYPTVFRAFRVYGVKGCAANANPFYTAEGLHEAAGGGAGSGGSAE